MSRTSREHHRQASGVGSIACAVVTVSDSRTPESDGSGRLLQQRVVAAGHRVSAYHVIPDEPDRLLAVLDDLLAGEARLILVNGGTGISRRDRTFDTLSARLERQLPGFGELFRSLSYAEIGAAAMLSRAVAGTIADRLIFSMPGSPAAVELAWDRLIEPEAAHLVWELAKE